MEEGFSDKEIEGAEKERSVLEINLCITQALSALQDLQSKHPFADVEARWLGTDRKINTAKTTVSLMIASLQDLRDIKDKNDPRYERAANSFGVHVVSDGEYDKLPPTE